MRNLTRNVRRTILTVGAIAVALFLFASLMSLPGVVNQILHARVNTLRIVVLSKGGFLYSLPYAYKRRIESIRHVELVLGEDVFMGTYRGPGDQIPSVAVDHENVREMFSDFGITQAAADEFKHVRTGALVGRALMRTFGWRIGQHITLRGTIYPVDIELQIVGTLAGASPDYALLFRRDYLEEALGRKESVNLFWVKVDRPESISKTIADIDLIFANSTAPTRTESELALAQNDAGNLRGFFQAVKILAGIVIAAVGLVAVNTASMSVRERRSEIAIMRAIGFTRARVMSCLLAEGFISAMMGGVVGCAIAYVALRLLPHASRTLGMLALIMKLPLRVTLASLATAAALGIFSSLLPVAMALRRDIAESMRAL